MINRNHPLTETDAAELWDTHAGDTVPWDDWYGGSRRALTSLLRAAFDAGQKYQDDLEDSTIRDIMQDIHSLRMERDDAIARAERAEDKLADSVHVDEAARRVEAAREQAWDEAARKALDGGWIDSEDYADLRAWNPHRPAQPLPPERDGVILVPADGHESITTTDGQEFSRLTYTTMKSIWYGPNIAAGVGDSVIQTTSPGRLTPGTWKVADDPR